MVRTWPLLSSTLLIAAVAWAGPGNPDDPNEAPLVGQPQHAPFSGAAGTRFEVSMHAEPVDVRVGDPIAFRIEIAAKGPWKRPPARPDLRRLSDFKKSFRIENQISRDRLDEKNGRWEFQYLLKPVSEKVSRVPSFPFLYFKPGIVPKEKGYRTVYADSIPLAVKAREEVRAHDVQDPSDSAAVEDLAGWDRRPYGFQSQPKIAMPGLFVLAMVLLVPPAFCAAWHGLWRKWNPDAARLAQIKKNRAARRALKALEKLATRGDNKPAKIAVVLTSYLRERLDFPAEQPTPEELAHFFSGLGLSKDLIERAKDFFQACDAARFAPAAEARPGDVVAAARRLVLSLEASLCAGRVS